MHQKELVASFRDRHCTSRIWSNHGWKAQQGARHHQASPCLMNCAIVTISSILRRENITASQRKSARQCAGRGVVIPAPISQAVPHRTLPCSGTWAFRGLCIAAASVFGATRPAQLRVGPEGTFQPFWTIPGALGGHASAPSASVFLSQECP